jgi:hypothetical protein
MTLTKKNQACNTTGLTRLRKVAIFRAGDEAFMDTGLKPSLRAWRAENGVSLEELAGATGYSAAMLSRVERGERRLSVLARIRLARSLGAKVQELFVPEHEDGQIEVR